MNTKRRQGPKQSGPGKHYRQGISLMDLMEMFPDDEAAERWFIETRWPSGIRCPRCDSDNVQERTTHPTMHHRCRACRKFFSVKTGTSMDASNISYRCWAIGIYLFATGLKGTSSMKLHRDLGIGQKAAWFMAHRIRECFNHYPHMFFGTVELDESYFGGIKANKHSSKRLRAGRGTVGKTAVAGARDHDTGEISAAVVPGTSRQELRAFTEDRVSPDATVYTDNHGGYAGMPNRYSVRHSAGEYVADQAHVNGLESFWATMKRGYMGTYHRMSPAHLQRYVNEFAGRHNQRSCDTVVQMRMMAMGLVGRRLPYRRLAVGRKRDPSGRYRVAT